MATFLACSSPPSRFFLKATTNSSSGVPKFASAIAAELRAAFSDPNVEVTVRSTRIEVSADERLASAWGSGLTTITDPATGRKTRIASKWLAVYRREGDGWKVAADAFNADDAMP